MDFELILRHLETTDARLEALGLALVLAAAYGLTRWQGGRASEDSVLFGRPPMSGLMFPLITVVLYWKYCGIRLAANAWW